MALCLSMLEILHAQKSIPVDANGKKIVNLTQSGTLKKQINKKEIPVVKELKIKGSINEDDIIFMSKLISLETVDITSAHIAQCNMSAIIPIPTVKKVIDKAKQYRNEIEFSGFISSANNDPSLIVKYTNIIKSNNTIPYLFTKLFPNIEQYKIKIDNYITNNMKFVDNMPDTLLFAITSYEISGDISRNDEDAYLAFQTNSPQLLVKESAILLDRSVQNEYCHVICGINKRDCLKKAICLYSSAISMIKLDQITIPKNLKYIINDSRSINTKSLIINDGEDFLFIGGRAFENSDIKKLEFNRPVFIGKNAFGNSKPDEVVFNKDVYLDKWIFNKDAYPKKIVFKNDVSYIDECFILKAKQVKFSKVPKNYVVYKSTSSGISYDTKPNYDVIIIPKGTKEQFVEKGISNNVYETCGHPLSLNIIVERPGTIMSYLSQDMFMDVDSLTITGLLYETDLNIINNCINISYLDLSKTYITYSPEELERQQKEKQGNYAVLSLLGYASETMYNDKQISSGDYQYAQLMIELMKNEIEYDDAKKGCYIPAGSLIDMEYLKTVKLPLRATDIYTSFNNCIALENIEFPLYLEGIYGHAFEGCTSLKTVNFPKSTVIISEMAFGQCDSIEVMDLSHLTFNKNLKRLFSNCNGIKVMKYPKGITDVEQLPGTDNVEYYFQESLNTLSFNNSYKNRKYHLKNLTPPAYSRYHGEPKGDTFYIPKGSTTSYYTKYGSSNTYIEE